MDGVGLSVWLCGPGPGPGLSSCFWRDDLGACDGLVMERGWKGTVSFALEGSVWTDGGIEGSWNLWVEGREEQRGKMTLFL